MTNLKSLTIWTIALSFIIIIGVGHGIACIGLLEIGGLLHKFDIGTEDFSLSLTASYDKSLAAVSLFALIGHILLILSNLTKRPTIILWTKMVGLFFLWTSFFYLTHNFFNDDLSQIGFFIGIPFLTCSILLVYRIIKQYLKTSSGWAKATLSIVFAIIFCAYLQGFDLR